MPYVKFNKDKQINGYENTKKDKYISKRTNILIMIIKIIELTEIQKRDTLLHTQSPGHKTEPDHKLTKHFIF